MKDDMHVNRPVLWLSFAILLSTIPACENGEDQESRVGLETHPPGAGVMPDDTDDLGVADTMRLRQAYEEIGEHYQQMMARYQGMTEQMSPQARQQYDQMRQHYEELLPEGAMDHGMMGHRMMSRHMMSMHDRSAWTRQMLAMHQQMAQFHAQEDHEEMAEMHEQMTKLYRDALEEMSAPPTP